MAIHIEQLSATCTQASRPNNTRDYPAAGGSVDSEDEIIKKSVINETSPAQIRYQGIGSPAGILPYNVID
jgi:hypothetical protein